MPEITLICERCSKVIAPDAGFLGVSMREVMLSQQAEKAFRAKHPEVVTSAELIEEFPEEVAWRSRHHACAPRADADAYEITAGRLATWADLARWTAHLLGKNWLGVTDWDDVLREAAGEIPSRRIRVVRSVAA